MIIVFDSLDGDHTHNTCTHACTHSLTHSRARTHTSMHTRAHTHTHTQQTLTDFMYKSNFKSPGKCLPAASLCLVYKIKAFSCNLLISCLFTQTDAPIRYFGFGGRTSTLQKDLHNLLYQRNSLDHTRTISWWMYITCSYVHHICR